MKLIKILRRLVVSILAFIGLWVVMLAIAGAIFYFSQPDVKEMKNCMVSSLYQVNLCPGTAHYVKLTDISPVFRNVLLISEDAGFYDHQGFDFAELQNSFQTNLKAQKVVRGGSTITQQLAKNVFLSSEKTMSRKIKEAILTYQIEKHFTKNEILERYVNVIQFGKDLFGIKDASWYYFHKLPSQLNVLESSFLVMLLPNPEKYSVSFTKKALTPFAKSRVIVLSKKLQSVGKITTLQYLRAVAAIDKFPWKELDLDAVAPATETLADQESEVVVEPSDEESEEPTESNDDDESKESVSKTNTVSTTKLSTQTKTNTSTDTRLLKPQTPARTLESETKPNLQPPSPKAPSPVEKSN